MNVEHPPRMVHPGRIIQREMDARGMSPGVLADLSGLSMRDIGLILDGEKRITNHHARGLARAFGTSVALWVSLQANYNDVKYVLQEAKAPK